ncbi:MAG: DegT/DnrJ/EryC1/StrS aminotransferase family protein [Pseudomonadota bacterium]|nr:DegT/DnrJ/EryC1/StrS aminotransferase family protein [Pseudomonadota bacterium]
MTLKQVLKQDADPEAASATDLGPKPDEAWPFYAEDEIEAVAEVLRSGRVNQWTGDTVARFQQACTDRFGGGHGIALANGSVALELPLLAFGIGPGDEVIVTPRSFVASASCVRLVGATPVFADVDPVSGNISVETIRAVLTSRTKAIIPVHLAGWPCDMPAIMELAQTHRLRVIEDCAQAHGAEVDGASVGSFGDAAAFSFCQDKIISTGGEGGFTSFKDEEEWTRAWSFKDHGKSWAKVNMPHTGTGFRWLHDAVGTNWRLTGPQAAIGLQQIAKLDEWREARSSNARIWAEALRDVPGIDVPWPDARFRHAFYKLYARLTIDDPQPKRDEILRRAADAGLRVFSGSCSEVYLEGAFADLPRPHLPNTRSLGERSLMVEVHPTLRPELLEKRAAALADIVRAVLGESSASR